jgi:hypothetical protein
MGTARNEQLTSFLDRCPEKNDGLRRNAVPLQEII